MMNDKDELLNFREARRLRREEQVQQLMEEQNKLWNFETARRLRQDELKYQQRRQEMTEQELMKEDIFYAAEEGNLEEIQCIVSRGVRVSVTNYSDWGIITVAAREGHANIVKYALENSKNSEYSENCLEDTFECAIIGGNLEIVKMLLDRGITSEHGIYEAIDRQEEEMVVYLVEHNSGVFNLYNKRKGSDPSILELAAHKELPLAVDCIIKKHPEMLDSRLVQNLAPDWLGTDVIKLLKKYLGYFDVSHTPAQHYNRYETESMLHMLVLDYGDKDSGKDFCGLYTEVKFLVAYGASVDEYERIWSDLLEPVPLRDTYHGIMDYAELVELHQNRKIYAEIFDEAVREGLGIWKHNQQVLREVMKWCGCVVMGYGGGSGGDVAGDVKRTNSTGIGGIVGIGKRAVDTLVQFAPAQFDEKLEVGTVRLLRAQVMLELGHGIVFGDVHHGGYVKYKDVTVSCDYHVEVRMKVLEHVKIVQVGGDSYVDEPLVGWQRLTRQHVTQPLIQHTTQGDVAHVWDNDVYDQKLYAQQQWYAETGEILPTFATTVRIVTGHEDIVGMHNPTQQNIRLNQNQHLMVAEDMQQPEHHAVAFLHSFSLL